MPKLRLLDDRTAAALFTPNSSSRPRLRSGLPLALLLLFTSLGLTGCSLLPRPAAMALPAGFAASPESAQLLNPATRRQAYARLFSALPKVQSQGDLTASGRWWRSKFSCQYHFLALPQSGEQGPSPLHLRGFLQQADLFDVIVNEGLMTVLFHPGKEEFQGPIPAEGSPFRRRFGVEPWDLAPVFTIGQLIATGQFDTAEGRRETTLTPQKDAAVGSVERIVLDGRSGLPRLACWRSGGNRYEVYYLGWERFTDSLTGEQTLLMPSRVEIRRRSPRTTLKLDVKKYQFNDQVSPAAFRVPPRSDYSFHPLPDLNAVLEEL